MRTLVILALFLSGFVQASSAQCEIDFGADTLVCEYYFEISPQPVGGILSLINCSGDGSYISLSEINDTFKIFFAECGLYQFEYHYQDVNCDSRDTLELKIENPDRLYQSVGTNASAGYVGLTCHSSASSCTNVVSISGQNPPLVGWDFCQEISCSLLDFQTVAINPDLDICIAESIEIDLEVYSDSYNGCNMANQSDIITVDDLGNIVSNDFLDFLGNITLNSLDSLDDCGIPDGFCFDDLNEPIDTLHDTIQLIIPVRIGGQWAYVGTDSLLLLDDTTQLEINLDSFELVIIPGADYYGPGQITFEMFEIVNSLPIPLTKALDIQLQWVEHWTYDTLEQIRKIPIFENTCDYGGLNHTIQIGGIPPYPCGPISIGFGDPCACMQMQLFVDVSGPISCYEPCVDLWASGSADEDFTIFWIDPFGQTIFGEFIFVCEAGPYLAILETASGCSIEAFVFVEDIGQDVIIDGPTALALDCGVECVSPDVSVSSFSTNLEFLWTGPNGFLSDELETTFCEPGIYNLNVLDLSNGCDADHVVEVIKNNDPIQINFDTKPEINCYDNCPSVQFTLSVSDQGISYLWTGPNGFTSDEKNPNFCEKGTYTLQVVSLDGCEGSESLIVKESITSPEILLQEIDKITCAQSCILLSIGQNVNNDAIVWTGPNNFYAEGNSVEVCDPGIYNVLVQDLQNGCITQKSFTVEALMNEPDFDIVGDLVICKGLCTEVQIVEEANTDISIKWVLPNGDIQHNSTINVCEQGQYVLEVTNNISKCTVQEVLNISAFSHEDFEVISKESCADVSDGSIEIELINNKQIHEVYINGLKQNDLVLTDLDPGLYQVELAYAGCYIKEEIQVEEIPDIKPFLKDEYSLCDESERVINISDEVIDSNTAIMWSNGSSDLIFMPEVEGLYHLELSNRCELIRQDFSVNGSKDYEAPAHYLPNVFTPNNDGVNDYFGFNSNQVLDHFSMQIFSRWGDLIYETRDQNASWNGVWKGRIVESGVYIYSIALNEKDCLGNSNLIKIQGDVSIVR